jgi:hypothetical protein
MVVAPPFAHLHHPLRRWQSLFLATMPLVGKSLQNTACCDISATVRLQVNEFSTIGLRLFRNTG